MADTQLTIVIPSFKPDFLAQALASLASQIDQNFKVLVADDGSPADLATIVKPFENRLHLRYMRFPENIGRVDLVAHWNRAIACAETDWVWIMGDDDELEPGCVATVNRFLRDSCFTGDIFRLNVAQIDHAGEITATKAEFPTNLSARAFALGRFQLELSSFACEYVIRRDSLLSKGGVVSFPHAWCSDDATWVMLAGHKGIHTLDGPLVRWRLSDVNISANNERFLLGKVNAMVCYLAWLRQFLTDHPATDNEPDNETVLREGLKWFHQRTLDMRALIPLSALPAIVGKIANATGGNVLKCLLDAVRVRRWVRHHRSLRTSQ